MSGAILPSTALIYLRSVENDNFKYCIVLYYMSVTFFQCSFQDSMFEVHPQSAIHNFVPSKFLHSRLPRCFVSSVAAMLTIVRNSFK
jgi:hypothetical protein